jgi:hypothetical protein
LLFLFDGIDQAKAFDCGRCVCSTDPATGFQNVDCIAVPFLEIRNTFAANTGFGDVNRFRVLPKVGDSVIPSNLLDTYRARIFNLTSCGSNVMTIDPNAFKSSSTTTLEFHIIDCNIGSLTWSFFNGFTSLNLLQLKGAANIQSLRFLPSLPSVKRLSITNCKGIGSLSFPGSSLTGLQNLVITENVELTDEKLESILTTLTTANGLEILSLKNNPFIFRIPDTLANLSALNWLDLSFCNIDSIYSDSLSFSAPAVKILDLTKMYLFNISDNSFENGISFLFLKIF